MSKQDDTKELASKNIRTQKLLNFLSGVAFIVPIIELFYTYGGLSIPQIILLSNIGGIAITVFELPTSVLADTFWRKKSLLVSVVCYLLSIVFLLFFPHWIWFIIASIFSALYFSFASWTSQAFLEENLRTLGQEKRFGEMVGNFMFWMRLPMFISPFIASFLLRMFSDTGYHILLWLDLVVALLLIVLTMRLKEMWISKSFGGIREAIVANRDTGIKAFQNIGRKRKLKMLLVYRCLSNHLGLLPIVLLPALLLQWMPEWYGALIIGCVGFFEMISNTKIIII